MSFIHHYFNLASNEIEHVLSEQVIFNLILSIKGLLSNLLNEYRQWVIIMKSHCMSSNELHYCLNLQVVISYIFSTHVFHFNEGLLLNFGIPCVMTQSQKKIISQFLCILLLCSINSTFNILHPICLHLNSQPIICWSVWCHIALCMQININTFQRQTYCSIPLCMYPFSHNHKLRCPIFFIVLCREINTNCSQQCT